MLVLSSDPTLAERQMCAVIFYLTTFGYIDGDFDVTEKDFVGNYIRKLITHRVESAMSDANEATKAELIDKYTAHFEEVFEGIDEQVNDLFTESVSRIENQEAFVQARLKTRCFEIFREFDLEGQEELMETVDELLMADGFAHPAEVKFRAELAEILEADLGIEMVETSSTRPPVYIDKVGHLSHNPEAHPFFERFEHHYSSDPERISEQVQTDLDLIDRVIAKFDEQRAVGAGRLTGINSATAFEGQSAFLDGHVYVLPKSDQRYEFLVLGDLHGCYSCLKGALMQFKFFDKVNRYKADKDNQPMPKLVLLGDYIDRGLFSYNGVLRTVLQIFLTAPEHVHILRGNHEYYLEHEGVIYGGVRPAEAINTLKPHLPISVFKKYRELFEALPNCLIYDQFFFVHGGIPKDSLLKERWTDLSSLNDKDMRFQMMWSDPSSADIIPPVLQDQSARFAFGRVQCQAFLDRLGCHTIIRGHEKVLPGFKRVYDDGKILLISLFSAGGKDNNDLPLKSGYRRVVPAAMTMTTTISGETALSPWSIDYKTYNDPERNAFFKVPPEIEQVRK